MGSDFRDSFHFLCNMYRYTNGFGNFSLSSNSRSPPITRIEKSFAPNPLGKAIATDTIFVIVPGSTQYDVKNNGETTGGGVDSRLLVIDLTSSDALLLSDAFITTALEVGVY